MSDAFAHWLSLREPADRAARAESLVTELLAHLPETRPLDIVDLGSGTGSNLRYLAPRLPSPQQWTLVDREADLLARGVADAPIAAVTARCQPLGSLEDASLFAGRDLVTGSALLDLVSDSWLGALAARCRLVGAAVLFVLNYDGRTTCEPGEPEDAGMLALFNQHQRANDHGFGRAAGPDAADAAGRHFAAVGYEVRRARADWQLGPEMGALQRPLILGWAEAIREVAPERRLTIDSWLERRLAHVEAGRSSIVVGHEDLCAWLPPGVR